MTLAPAALDCGLYDPRVRSVSHLRVLVVVGQRIQHMAHRLESSQLLHVEFTTVQRCNLTISICKGMRASS
jgi:hypothetical protein